jgi:hypothetical protein
MTDQRAGREVYEAFILEQLQSEESRKTSIESRGVSVVTTSGALVTLLFALAAIETSRKGFVLPADARFWLKAALVSFVVAAILAVLSNLPLPYRTTRPEDLQFAIEELWSDGAAEATQMTSATRVTFLRRAQNLNQVKGYVLLGAFGAEVVAVALLAVAISKILAGTT